MYTLNLNQIQQIEQRILEQGVNYSHLADDLIDHICCEIELKIEKGTDFNNAYKEVFDKIGFNGLKEIQEATIFYVKLNLRMMKKIMNVSALSGLALFVTGFLFKINHWPGASMLYFLGFLTIFLGFFPSALISLRKELKINLFSKNFLSYLVGALILTESGAAMLFISMHWPGGNILALISWGLLLFVFFPIVFYKVFKSKTNRILNLSLSIFSFVFVSLSILMTFNRSTSVFNIINYTEYETELNYYQSLIKSVDYKDFSLSCMEKLEELNTSLEEVDASIESLKKNLLSGSESHYEMSVRFLQNTKIFYNLEDNIIDFKIKLEQYIKLALELSNSNTVLSDYISTALSVQRKNYGLFQNISWESRNFHCPGGTAGVYSNLGRIHKNIYHIHYEVLKLIANKNAPE